MSEYGVTPAGFVKKRLDKIIEETQAYLTDELGFDVSLNPQSALNVFITNQADRFAQLWEVAEQVYYSHYPSTAEGVSLDNAGQFSGIIREGDQRTKYLVLCTGTDGTAIPKGSVISSSTTPKVYFSVDADYEISRLSFNKAFISVVAVEEAKIYSVSINDQTYSVLSSPGDTSLKIIEKLKNEIKNEDFTVVAHEELLEISCNSETVSNRLELSDNLTTEYVSSLILWQSVDYGKFVLPEKSITEIVTTVAGFDLCYNVSVPIYGRLRESDTEFRQSLLKKVASRSTSMLESITASILENVEGVITAYAHENSGDTTDKYGRPPHSIEVMVDGGEEAEIASEILSTKAAGIATFGDIAVNVPTSFGDTVTVRFNRPSYSYVWFSITVYRNSAQPLPPNYEELIKGTILECISELKAGDSVYPQDYISRIKSACTGLGLVRIYVEGTPSKDYVPVTVGRDFWEITPREKVFTSSDRIEVVLL